MLNALSSYLQNLPHPSAQTATTSSVDAAPKAVEQLDNRDGYVPSSRAIMVSAIASDFDVRALERQDIGKLQLKLQQYGLLNGRDLDAYSLLSTQVQQESGDTVDAVAILDQATSFNENSLPFSERQAVLHLHRLLHNLDSARQLLSPAKMAN